MRYGPCSERPTSYNVTMFRMREARRCLRLHEQPLLANTTMASRAHRLERDAPTEFAVLSFPDHAEAAPAQLADERIFALGHSSRAGDGAALQGIAASAGEYVGVAHVVHGEEEFGKLRVGDVLVCNVTSPVWSLLFPTIGALVTDVGGILSHPAIIAREYRIPAVVATGRATHVLSDGQGCASTERAAR